PLVVVAHGTTGMGPTCAPAYVDPLKLGVGHNSVLAMSLALVGYGFAVIAPDYAGFGEGTTPGWTLAPDVARSLLDATRAMRAMTSGLSERVYMVGHSTGGHAVLAAQAVARTYGLAGNLVAVLPMGGAWIDRSVYGARIGPASSLTTEKDGYALLFTVYYFY